MFEAHGLDVDDLLVDRDAQYVEFAKTIESKRQLKDLIEADTGVVKAETLVAEAIERWWAVEQKRFDGLASTADLVGLRKNMIGSFETALKSATMLDRFAVNGIIAAWWGTTQPDLKALATIGYKGLIEAWVTTVLDALEEEKSKVDPLDHKVARALLPEYLDDLASQEAEVAELDSTIKAATADDEEGAEQVEDSPSEADIKKLRSKLTAARKQLKADKTGFAKRLSSANAALDVEAARALVVGAFRRDVLRESDDRVGRHRRVIISAFEIWWDKYKVTFNDLETERDAAAAKLAGFLKELGYE